LLYQRTDYPEAVSFGSARDHISVGVKSIFVGDTNSFGAIRLIMGQYCCGCAISILFAMSSDNHAGELNADWVSLKL